MRRLFAFLVTMVCLLATPATALDAINVPFDTDALDLTRAVDRFVEVGDRIQVSTAPGPDGIVRRIEVRSREETGAGSWVVFALSNTSNEQVDRLLVAPHFRLADSRIFWPDLGASRLVAISPSQGLSPERLESQEADVYRITLDPGAVVTYVAELRTSTLPQLILWQEDAYRDSVNATTLYKGIVLGIAGLLALFLSILFIVKRSVMFPAVAAVAWAALAYLAIEFGFWNQIFNLQPGEEQTSRAIAELALAATLVFLVYAYLGLASIHRAFFQAGVALVVLVAGLVALSMYEPQIVTGIARLGLGAIGLGGLAVIVPMAIHRFDRAIHLIPSWIILLAWLLAGWLAVTGQIVNDFVAPALAGGLVLIVLLLGFTVMQHAFAGGSLSEGLVSDSERKMLALGGSGDLIWDWDLARDRVYSSPATEDLLGLKRGSLAGPFLDWLSAIHPGERDHFRHVVEAVVENARGRIDQTVRMRTEDGHFRWFRLRARPVVGEDEKVFRLIGTMLDVTDMKTTQERLLRDAVHDSLTGLPNRELFLDRVNLAMQRAQVEQVAKPTVIIVNIDHFAQHNEAVGVSTGDSILTMVARRIDKLLRPQDSLSRIGADQFGLLLLSEQEPTAIARFTEQVRRAMQAPVVLGDQEVNLTASIGVATFDPSFDGPEDALKSAEIAMAHAKRLGGDRCEAFRHSLREHGRSLVAVEADLRRALEQEQLSVYYQPIVRLSDGKLAGFEALLRWDHPRHGRMAPAEFVPIAERSGLIIPVGLFVLERAARDLNYWMRIEPKAAEFFTSINISSRQLLRHDLLNDLRAILARADLPGSAIKLELTESLVMENPEYAKQVLARCRELGIGLSLDDFGTGYSSLSYLQRFPFDTIKIDQSFVKAMAPGEPAVVLSAIVALGHDLEMDIVAEGIEDGAIAEELAKMGCEFGQGFLYGHPIPASGVPAFFNRFEADRIARVKAAEAEAAAAAAAAASEAEAKRRAAQEAEAEEKARQAAADAAKAAEASRNQAAAQTPTQLPKPAAPATTTAAALKDTASAAPKGAADTAPTRSTARSSLVKPAPPSKTVESRFDSALRELAGTNSLGVNQSSPSRVATSASSGPKPSSLTRQPSATQTAGSNASAAGAPHALNAKADKGASTSTSLLGEKVELRAPKPSGGDRSKAQAEHIKSAEAKDERSNNGSNGSASSSSSASQADSPLKVLTDKPKAVTPLKPSSSASKPETEEQKPKAASSAG